MIYECKPLRVSFTLPQSCTKLLAADSKRANNASKRNNLKQQGMNAKFNSLCKRSSNLIIQLCVNIMQFSDPNEADPLHATDFFSVANSFHVMQLFYFLCCVANGDILLCLIMVLFRLGGDAQMSIGIALHRPPPRTSYTRVQNIFVFAFDKQKSPRMVHRARTPNRKLN